MEASHTTHSPAPWNLQGKGYICLLRRSQILETQAFIPGLLCGRWQMNSRPLIMFMDYADSPIGPYHELLFIPGRFSFEDGEYLSISRIFVSSISSQEHGRRNWGIPKELAEFTVSYNEQGLDSVTVNREGKLLAKLTFQARRLSLPFHTNLLPKAWNSFVQYDKGQTFFFRPKASGWLQLAKLIETSFDSDEFPSISPKHVIATIKISDFQLHFPKAKKSSIFESI